MRLGALQKHSRGQLSPSPVGRAAMRTVWTTHWTTASRQPHDDDDRIMSVPQRPRHNIRDVDNYQCTRPLTQLHCLHLFRPAFSDDLRNCHLRQQSTNSLRWRSWQRMHIIHAVSSSSCCYAFGSLASGRVNDKTLRRAHTQRRTDADLRSIQ